MADRPAAPVIEPATAAPPRRRVRRRWPWIVAAVLLSSVPALVLAALLANPDRHRPRLEAAASSAAGRAVTIRGTLRISRSLWPTIEVTDVALANLPGGSRPDMAHAERIAARLSLWALLRRRVEIDQLTLAGPDILFELADGRPNWVFAPLEAKAGTKAGPETGASPVGTGSHADPASGISFDIRATRIRDGMVTWRLPGRTHVVGIRHLALDHPARGAPFDLASELVYGDNHPFAFDASVRPEGSWNGPWRARMDLSAFDATLSASGTVAPAGAYDLQLDGRIPALERLNALWPALRLPPVHGLALSARVADRDLRGAPPVAGPAKARFEGTELGILAPEWRLGAAIVSIAKPGAPVSIAGEAEWRGLPFDYRITAGLPAKAEAALSLPVDLALRAGRANSRLSLQGRLGLRDGGFDGLDATIALHADTLDAWRAALPAIPSAALPALEDLDLRGRLELPAGPGRISLRDASLSSRQVAASGDVSTSRPGSASGSEARARLRVTRLDLDALPPGGAPLAGNAALPWAALRGPRLDIEARIEAMTWRRRDWRDLFMRVRLDDGMLHPASLRLALPGGPAEISLEVEAGRRPTPVGLSLHAPGLPLSLVLREAGLPVRAEGAMRIDAELRARGDTPRELASSLDGALAATMRGGAIGDAALRALAGPALKALDIAVPADGATPIRCAVLRGRFSNGVGRFDTIALHAGDGVSALQLSGAGQVDLRDDTLALKLRPLARLSGARVSVPVLVEGRLGAPRARLDAGGLDKLGLLVDAWFGGDHPRTCEDAGLPP